MEELDWIFDDGFSAYARQGLDQDGGSTLTREELQPLAPFNVGSLHKFEFFTYLGPTDVDDMYGAQAEGGKQRFAVIKCFIERHFFGVPDASLGGVCR